jgi:hypothetical protein
MMSFKNFTSPDLVAEKYNLILTREEPFDYKTVSSIQPPAVLQQDLEFELRHHPYSMNEQTLCEGLIYPLLREVWKHHLSLQIWSHITLQVDDELVGIPDYLVSKKSPRGLTKLEIPLVAVIEAKQENFAAGWGQCLAGLVAAQKLNSGLNPQPSLYGIVTTGKSWEFGQLEGNEVKIHPFSLSLAQLEVLLGALDYILGRCEAQLASVSNSPA